MSGRALPRALALTAALGASACFATRGDLRVLQQDLAVVRAEQLRADSAHRAQLRQVTATLRDVADSLRVVREVSVRGQAETGRALYDINQQLLTIQELTGQSQKRIQELRASLEQRSEVPLPAPVVPVAGGTSAPTPAAGAGAPGPNALFQLAQDQLRRQSASAARAGFTDLLERYPKSDLAPEALFYVAESWAADGNAAAADSVYAQVVARFPASSKAPTALYKRARARRLAGDLTEARALLRRILDRYPRSDEAILAADELKDISR